MATKRKPKQNKREPRQAEVLVRSVEPAHSSYLKNAAGKGPVRKKGEDFLKRVEAAHRLYTSEPVIGGNHFSVGREMDLTVQGHGRIQINQIMVYEVRIRS